VGFTEIGNAKESAEGAAGHEGLEEGLLEGAILKGASTLTPQSRLSEADQF
jgi:hypothetical protein